MLEIIEKPFTTKHPVLYCIKIKNGCYDMWLTSIIEKRIVNCAKWLEENNLTDWQKFSHVQKMRVIAAGLI